MTTPTDPWLAFNHCTLSPVRRIVNGVDQLAIAGQDAIDVVRRILDDLDQEPTAKRAFTLGYWGSIHEDLQVRDYVRSALEERKMWHDQQGWYFHWMANPRAWETQYKWADPIEFAVAAAVCDRMYPRGTISMYELGGDVLYREGRSQHVVELPEVIRSSGGAGWHIATSQMFKSMGYDECYPGEPREARDARVFAIVRPTLLTAAWLIGRPHPAAPPQTLTHKVYSVVRPNRGILAQVHPVEAQAAAMLWTAMKLWQACYGNGTWQGWTTDAARSLRRDLWWMSRHLQAAVTDPGTHHVQGVLTQEDALNAKTMSYPARLIDPMRLPFRSVSYYPYDGKGAAPSLIRSGRNGVYYQANTPDDVLPLYIQHTHEEEP